MIQYKIDYPEEVESRRKKISNNMKRTLRMGNEEAKKEDWNSESLGHLSDSNSIDSSPSENSYISEDSHEDKNEAILSPRSKTPSKR